MADALQFSVVVATRNEEDDILRTLDALTELDPPALEILVVDASDDRTPDLVAEYADERVVLVHQNNRGRSEGRNQGIRLAKGDIVVILNADVRVPRDFVARLRTSYDSGADYVVVETRVSNQDDLFGRFVDAQHRVLYDISSIRWTEGFSVRREIALAAGLFPEVDPIPLCAGEDWIFVDRLNAYGARRDARPDIVVEHVVPASFGAFIEQRVGRGRGTPLLLYGWAHKRYPVLVMRTSIKLVLYAVRLVTLVSVVRAARRYSARSPRGSRDLVGFVFAEAVERCGQMVGEVLALRDLARARRSARRGRAEESECAPVVRT